MIVHHISSVIRVMLDKEVPRYLSTLGQFKLSSSQMQSTLPWADMTLSFH